MEMVASWNVFHGFCELNGSNELLWRLGYSIAAFKVFFVFPWRGKLGKIRYFSCSVLADYVDECKLKTWSNKAIKENATRTRLIIDPSGKGRFFRRTKKCREGSFIFSADFFFQSYFGINKCSRRRWILLGKTRGRAIFSNILFGHFRRILSSVREIMRRTACLLHVTWTLGKTR